MEDYKQLYKSEKWGEVHSLGIDIKIACPIPINDSMQRAAHEAADIIEQAITLEFHATDPESQARAAEEKKDLLNCFPVTPLYVKAIPNGYCNRACCAHLPWYQVTTAIGVITLGWRKRVISIDWTDSDLIASAQALFPNEDVTKQGKLIHAWSYDKAREYIAVLLANQG